MCNTLQVKRVTGDSILIEYEKAQLFTPLFDTWLQRYSCTGKKNKTKLVGKSLVCWFVCRELHSVFIYILHDVLTSLESHLDKCGMKCDKKGEKHNREPKRMKQREQK